MKRLDCTVVIDIAMTETAKHADYILPTTTQYEKAEATFFNFEFPNNYPNAPPKVTFLTNMYNIRLKFGAIQTLLVALFSFIISFFA